MRIALIADIHGNVVALDEVLAELEKKAVDQIVCLGDVAAGGPRPAQTLERLRELDCPVVMGNADQWLLTPQNAVPSDETLRWFSDIGSWCRNRLSDEQLSYIESFVPTFEQRIDDDATILCYHGSPRSNTEHLTAMTPEDDLDEIFASVDADVLAGGHTHVQLFRRYTNAILLNPGSVGLPYEIEPETGVVYNRPEAEYALVEARGGSISVSLQRVPFDVETVAKDVRESDMPHADQWLEDWKVEN
ncbi:metallophosphoesterase family protein [Halorubrum lacusprofundi]|jgi:putative phosphoesterase|uniref:metallophosphoesterase family protein n=1 Tax=Halorubrum lacusprofundi TaxID=2247 RepID=UPI001482D7E9|nr:YfcE family phosphodiesterase [Halorubrum lacusprofundi]MCG1007732.1 YfcE family phosphodiesterase [Halorubrum lacusprofundi]